MYTPNNFYPAEMGGPSYIESIIDRQEGPTCGFEAVENVVQLFGGGSNNLIYTHLLRMAANHGALWRDAQGFILDPSGYQPLLAEFGIAASWHEFDHLVLIRALRENRVALVVLDAHEIDPKTYPEQGSPHAIIVTNYVVDPVRRRIVAYIGADSNHPGQERFWSIEAVERATRYPSHVPLLITDSPAVWSSKANHYVRLTNGVVIPVTATRRG